jgi:DNA-binding transcriptional LysR family regulator
MGPARKVSLRVPHLANLAEVVSTTDLVLTIPTRVAEALATGAALRVGQLPLPVASFDVNLYWQERAADTTAQQCLCETIANALAAV